MSHTKTHNKLNNKPLADSRGLTSTSYTQSYTHKNPNQYNGETIVSQVVEGKKTHNKKVFIESYGCSMNFADSEVVASILSTEGFETTVEMKEAESKRFVSVLKNSIPLKELTPR